MDIANGTGGILPSNEYLQIAAATCKGLLEVAQNLPFIKPLAAVMIMFYETYEQCQQNKELFKDLVEEVDEGKLWIMEVGRKGVSFENELAESVFKKLVGELFRAQAWIKNASPRYNGETTSTTTAIFSAVKSFALSPADQDKMNTFIAKMKDYLIKFPVVLSGLVALSTMSEEMTKLMEELKVPTFQNTIDTLCQQFLPGARQWIFSVLTRWLRSTSDDLTDDLTGFKSRLFWIRADAGMGKSVLAGMIAQQYKEIVVGSVFFNFTDVSLSSPETMTKSLAFQIAVRYPAVQQDLREFFKNQKQEQIACSISKLFEELVLKPLQKISQNLTSSCCLIIIDAIDECAMTTKRGELLRFLGNQLLKKAPMNVKFLITSRPEPDIIETLSDFKPYEIKEDDERHQADLRRFIEMMLKENHLFDEGESLQSATEKIYERSERKFIYAALLKEEIRGWKRLPRKEDRISRLLALPKGVDCKFREVMKSCNFAEHVDFLSVMVIVKETLSEEQLLSLLDEEKVDKAIEELGKLFLYRKNSEDKGQSYFVPFHKSIIDWLTEEKRSKEFYIDKKKAHQYLISRLLSVFGVFSMDSILKHPVFSLSASTVENIFGIHPLTDYLLNHLPDHLDDIEEYYGSFILLTCLSWLRGREKQGGVKSIKEDYTKRLQSSAWLKQKHHSCCLEEFQYIFEFFSLLEPNKDKSFIFELADRFQQLLLSSAPPLQFNSRISLMVREAVVDYKVTVNIHRQGIQVGGSLNSSIWCDAVTNKMFVLQEEGILVIVSENSLDLVDVSTSLAVTDRLEFDDDIKLSLFSNFLFIVQVGSQMEFWKLDRKKMKWQLLKTEDWLVSTLFRISVFEVFAWCIDSDTGFIIELDTLDKREISDSFPISEVVKRLELRFDEDRIITEYDFKQLQNMETELEHIGVSLLCSLAFTNFRVWVSDGYHMVVLDLASGDIDRASVRFLYYHEDDGLSSIPPDVNKVAYELTIDNSEIQIIGNYTQDTYDSFYYGSRKIPVSGLKQISYYEKKRILIVRTTEKILFYRLDKLIEEHEKGECFNVLFYPLCCEPIEYMVIVWTDENRQVIRKGLLAELFDSSSSFREITAVPGKRDIIEMDYQADGSFSIYYEDDTTNFQVLKKQWLHGAVRPVEEKLFQLCSDPNGGIGLLIYRYNTSSQAFEYWMDLVSVINSAGEKDKRLVRKAIVLNEKLLKWSSSSGIVFNALPLFAFAHTHAHPLKKELFVYREGKYICNVCRENGSGAVYHCQDCKFDSHPYCLSIHELFPKNFRS
jgi:hypothetical protein